MAKTTLPKIDDEKPAVEQETKTEAQPSPQPQPKTEEVVGYVPRRVDIKLSVKHRHILHKKLRMLQDSGARLQDGTEVSDRTKAVLWILENEVKL